MTYERKNFKTLGILIALLIVGAVAYRYFNSDSRDAAARAERTEINWADAQVEVTLERIAEAIRVMRESERAEKWPEAVKASEDGLAAAATLKNDEQNLKKEAENLFTAYREAYKKRLAGVGDRISIDVSAFARAMDAFDAARAKSR